MRWGHSGWHKAFLITTALVSSYFVSQNLVPGTAEAVNLAVQHVAAVFHNIAGGVHIDGETAKAIAQAASDALHDSGTQAFKTFITGVIPFAVAEYVGRFVPRAKQTGDSGDKFLSKMFVAGAAVDSLILGLGLIHPNFDVNLTLASLPEAMRSIFAENVVSAAQSQAFIESLLSVVGNNVAGGLVGALSSLWIFRDVSQESVSAGGLMSR
jgi:hypothetical protein